MTAIIAVGPRRGIADNIVGLIVKMLYVKMTDVKLTDVKLTDQMTGHEIGLAGHNNAGYETDSEAANV